LLPLAFPLAFGVALRYNLSGVSSGISAVPMPDEALDKAWRKRTVIIWVNEQIDPCGIIRACIACCDETQAQECHDSFDANLTAEQKQEGWVARMRTVESWDEVPVNALKLD